MKHQDDDDYSAIDKIYIYVKGPNEVKYQYLIKKRDSVGFEHLKD